MKAIFFLLASAALLTSCDREESTAPSPPTKSPGAEAKAFFDDQDKTVVTFVGFSGKGYQNEQAMLLQAKEFLARHKPESAIVNIGVTPDGIGAVYELAKKMGFTTTGIVSSQARDLAPSKFVDHSFYIEDESWGGFREGTNQLSPTSQSLVENSDLMVGIGGGAVARDELKGAQKKGIPIHFFPADMNHAKAIKKARAKDQPDPTDYRGEAAVEFAP